MTEVVLLDPGTDQPIGSMEKLRAHREGHYHSAISVLLVNSAGLHIVQRRAASKYHSGDLWANAACSHPVPGEAEDDAAHRRLQEEMGISCPLARLGIIRYRAEVPSQQGQLIEHERVTLFGGVYDGPISGNATEVSETRCISTHNVSALRLTTWFELYRDVLLADLHRTITQAVSTGAMFRDYGSFLDHGLTRSGAIGRS